MLFKLSKVGYGSIKDLEEMQINTFIDLLNYENFISQYERAVYDKINKQNKS